MSFHLAPNSSDHRDAEEEELEHREDPIAAPAETLSNADESEAGPGLDFKLPSTEIADLASRFHFAEPRSTSSPVPSSIEIHRTSSPSFTAARTDVTRGTTSVTSIPASPTPPASSQRPQQTSQQNNSIAAAIAGVLTSGDHDNANNDLSNGTQENFENNHKESPLREVGNQATWSLSSCKPGFGVEQLRDNSVDTYWQSDGQLPHLVNVQFRRKTTVHDVAVYTDFKQDESYTPSKISVRCGTNFNDLQEIEVIELKEPSGWVSIPLKDLNDRPVRTFMVQIAIISNHQQGRDTHLRQIKVHSPVEEKRVTSAPFVQFKTIDFLQHVNVR